MRYLSFLIVIFLVAGCVSKNDHKNDQHAIAINYGYNGFFIDTLTLNVDQKIFSATIDSIKRPIDTYKELLVSKNFRNIFDHPRIYLNNVIAYLSDSSKSQTEKTIAIMTMQRKDYFNNLNFVYACDYLYRQNFIDEEILFETLFPRLDSQNRDIVKNYRNDKMY